MNLTFEGFLKGYCRELSGQQSLSFRKLVKQATTVAPRVAEPLILLALAQGKAEYVLGLSEGLCTPNRVAWHLYAPRTNFLIVMPTFGVRIER